MKALKDPNVESQKQDFRNPEWKRSYNISHFGVAASRYDIATRALSFFRDGAWKRDLVGGLPDLSAPRILDLACGTGDITFALAARYPAAEVIGLDITPEMIVIADKRRDQQILLPAGRPSPRFMVGDIDSLPFDENSFDLVTGGYALRNAPSLPRAFEQIRRVLKVGGTASFLDFAKPCSSIQLRIQQGALQLWGSLWGLLLHADPSIHGYIAKSLAVYPPQEELFSMAESAGLIRRSRKQYMFKSVEVFSFSAV